MDANIEKVLGNRRRALVDSRKRKPAKYFTHLSGASSPVVARFPPLKSSSVKLGKRKKPDGCRTRCRNCKVAWRRSLVRSYANFMKTGLPDRVMVYKDGDWTDLSSDIVGLVRKGFEHKKAAIEVKLNGRHLVLDFLHMVHFDMKAGIENPLAWIDLSGSPFFPETYVDDDEEQVCCRHAAQKDEYSEVNGAQEIKLQIDIDLNGIDATNAVEYCGESNPLVKRIKVAGNPDNVNIGAEVGDSCDRVSDAQMNFAAGSKMKMGEDLDMEMSSAGQLNYDAVKELFLLGMNKAGRAEIIEIRRCSGPMLEHRMALFQKQLEITKKIRGSTNVRFAWLASDKEALSSLVSYGLKSKPSYGNGVHLTAAHGCYTSAKHCDVDENGVRHMVLCRVILGNMELVLPGSKLFHPVFDNFDSGVDDPQNPMNFVVPLMNANTRIYPEYFVSFKLSSDYEGVPVGNTEPGGALVTPRPEGNLNMEASPVDVASGYHSNLSSEGSKERPSSLNSSNVKAPRSPYLPFPLLFEAISDKVSPDTLNRVLSYYGDFRKKKMSRTDFIKMLRNLVSDSLLRSTITSLHVKKPTKNDFIPKQEVEA